MGWVGGSSGEGERRYLGDLSSERSGLIEWEKCLLCIMVIIRFSFARLRCYYNLFFYYVLLPDYLRRVTSWATEVGVMDHTI